MLHVPLIISVDVMQSFGMCNTQAEWEFRIKFTKFGLKLTDDTKKGMFLYIDETLVVLVPEWNSGNSHTMKQRYP